MSHGGREVRGVRNLRIYFTRSDFSQASAHLAFKEVDIQEMKDLLFYIHCENSIMRIVEDNAKKPLWMELGCVFQGSVEVKEVKKTHLFSVLPGHLLSWYLSLDTVSVSRNYRQIDVKTISITSNLQIWRDTNSEMLLE